MIRSSTAGFAGVLRVSLAASVLLALGSGCGPEVEVLTGATGGGAGAGGSGTTAGLGPVAGTGGTTAGSTAAGTGGTGEAGAGDGVAGSAGTTTAGGASVCNGLTPEVLMTLESGGLCSDADVCEPFGCAGLYGGNGTAAFAACRNNQIQLITMDLLDGPLETPLTPLDNGVTWDDCEDAMDEGVSGEACTWNGSCIRPTDDTCCREGAECWAGVGVLRRIRICAPDCEKHEPDTSLPVVTDCASAAAAERCHATPPCEGDFTCYGTAGDWVVTEYDDMAQVNGALWCAGGALVGGYGLSWGP